jgi:hypothetical protein
VSAVAPALKPTAFFGACNIAATRFAKLRKSIHAGVGLVFFPEISLPPMGQKKNGLA